MKHSLMLLLLASLLMACTPQATITESTATSPALTQTSLPFTPTFTSTALPTATILPTDTPSATPPTCATPINPLDNATVPARGPFDFQWTAFTGAASYIVSIGPANWYPTNFSVNGTLLTRYMENFPSSPSYQWSITAVNAAGQEICKAGPYTFLMSAEVLATASFNTNVVTSNGSNSSDNSSSSSQNGSGNGSNSGGPSSTSGSDISIISFSDSDDSQCRLSAGFKVKSNATFEFFRLIYSYNGQEGAVDFTSGPLNPYPAYNFYNATTPPLAVKQGDTVKFGVWYKTNTGEQSKGLTLSHVMSNCSQ